MISVVVPVYNVEQYLRSCIESILAQTYKNFEIILVDDGSKDTSGKICDDFAENYPNIVVIHKENKGLSDTRNVGTKIAKGEFITFVDSDDIIHPKYLEILINLIEKYNADVSCCEFNFFSDFSSINFECIPGEEKCFTGINAASEMLYGKLHGSSACAILMRNNICINNPFTLGRYHEDDLVSFKYYLSAKQVAVTEKRLYYYYQRPGSIMHSPYGKIAIDELNAADYIVDNCKLLDLVVRDAAFVKKFYNYRDVIITYPNLKKIDSATYRRIKKGLKEICSYISLDNKAPKRIRLSAFIFSFLGLHAMLFFTKHFGL